MTSGHGNILKRYQQKEDERSEQEKKDREKISSLNMKVDAALRLKSLGGELDEAEEDLIKELLDKYTGDKRKSLGQI